MILQSCQNQILIMLFRAFKPSNNYVLITYVIITALTTFNIMLLMINNNIDNNN